MHKTLTNSPKTYSISCYDIPDAFIENKLLVKNHFQKFGKVSRIVIRNKRKSCTIEFDNEESARAAISHGNIYDGYVFRVGVTKTRGNSNSQPKDVKKTIKKPWPMDSDVLDELEAMKGAYTPGSSFALRKEESKPKEKQKKDVGKPATKMWKVKKTDLSLNINMDLVNELLTTMSQQTTMPEQQYRILDARDKLMRLKLSRQSELKKATRTIGTCPDMCPEKERLQREAQHQVSLFEQSSNRTGNSRMDHTIAVKQYSRSSADQEAPLAHELRPVEILQKTMSYLLNKIMDLCETPDVNIGEWYHFLWDRTRGIRKDITQQELCCQGSVKLVEQCARFHVHCSARLVAEDPGVFDQRINTENLTKCLQTLKYMYGDLAIQGERCPNEAEFRGYIVLLNLNDGNFMWELQQLSYDIQRSPQVRFALQVHSAIDKNNYVRFFKLVRETTYLNACILLRYFNQVRLKALITILKSCAPRHPYTNFPVTQLSNMLAFEDVGSTIDFLEYYGLPLSDDGTHVILDRKTFSEPNLPFQPDRAIKLVESKRICSIGEVVCGTELPPNDFINPHRSFDIDGYLKINEVPREWRSKYTNFRNIQHVSDVSDTPETPTVSPAKSTASEMSTFSSVGKFTFCLPSNLDTPPVLIAPTTPIFRFQAPKDLPPLVDETDSKPMEIESTLPTITFTPPTVPLIVKSTPMFKIPEVKPISVAKTIPPIIKPDPPVISPMPPVVFKPVTQFKETQKEQKLEISYKRTRNEQTIHVETKIPKYSPALIKPVVDIVKETIKTEFIETEVKDILDNVIAKVVMKINEEVKMKEKLKLISQKIKARRLLIYIDKWKSIVQSKRKERTSFLNNPVWVSIRTTQEEANELRMNNQNVSLQHIKEYVTGTRNFSPPKDFFKPTPKLNVPQLVWQILYERLSKNTKRPNLDIFWKVTFVVESTNNYTIKYLNHLLNNSFDLDDNKTIGNWTTQIGTKFNYAVEKIDIDYDSNGCCYIVDYDSLRPFLSRNSIGGNVPVLIIVCNGPKNEKNNTPFEIIHLGGPVTSAVLIASLKWLAYRVNSPPPLYMNTLPSLIQSCAGQELFDRIRRAYRINIRLEISLRNPNTAINLYNNGLKNLQELIIKTNSDVSFPEEFKKYLNHPVMLPCTYEYFPNDWKERNNKTATIIKRLVLPEWTDTWPPYNSTELYEKLQTYSSRIAPNNDRTFARILNVLTYLFNITDDDFQDEIKILNWCDILEIISTEQIRSLTNTEPSFCVYHSDELERLRTEPWWYDCIEFMKKIKSTKTNESDIVYDSDWSCSEQSDDEIDVNATILEASDALVKFDTDKDEDLHKEILDLNAMVDDLEESLEIQKKILSKFNETVNVTLQNI